MNKTYTAGEKVFTVRFGSWNCFFTPATVTKVTPKGQIVVTFASGNTSRFNADGSVIGSDSYCSKLDDVSYEERIARLAEEDRAKTAVSKIKDIQVNAVYAQWGKDGLMKEIVRLQALLDAAKEAVEAI
jgi:hypothetical protein